MVGQRGWGALIRRWSPNVTHIKKLMNLNREGGTVLITGVSSANHQPTQKMTAPVLDKRITALENEIEALRRRKLRLLKGQLERMGVAVPESARRAAGSGRGRQKKR